ncbi:death-associated protein 1 isoform X1 [Tyto alba]|nr:death-associated protein 1 isoform X1 [Tyto alba]
MMNGSGFAFTSRFAFQRDAFMFASFLKLNRDEDLKDVKAGGMRIVQKHPHSSDAKEERDKDDQDWENSSPPKPAVFISGVIARGDKDFPPAAAQVAHQKPHPSVEKLPHPQHVKQHIHQPRK